MQSVLSTSARYSLRCRHSEWLQRVRPIFEESDTAEAHENSDNAKLPSLWLWVDRSVWRNHFLQPCARVHVHSSHRSQIHTYKGYTAYILHITRCSPLSYNLAYCVVGYGDNIIIYILYSSHMFPLMMTRGSHEGS